MQAVKQAEGNMHTGIDAALRVTGKQAGRRAVKKHTFGQVGM